MLRGCADPNVTSTIPPRCCAIPFTLNGVVHYSCILENNDVGCLYDNREWKLCQQPAGNSRRYTRLNCIKQGCAAEMAVRYAALRACHCNSLGGATWRSVMIITGRTDRQTDRVRRNMRPPPKEEGRIINWWRRWWWSRRHTH